MSTIKEQFEQEGYYLAKGVFAPNEVATLEQSFDHILAQITAANEDVNARWSGPERGLTEEVGLEDSAPPYAAGVTCRGR